MKFIIYRDRKHQFRWKLKSRNNKIIANAGESFTRKANCKKSIANLSFAAESPVIDLTVKR